MSSLQPGGGSEINRKGFLKFVVAATAGTWACRFFGPPQSNSSNEDGVDNLPPPAPNIKINSVEGNNPPEIPWTAINEGDQFLDLVKNPDSTLSEGVYQYCDRAIMIEREDKSVDVVYEVEGIYGAWAKDLNNLHNLKPGERYFAGSKAEVRQLLEGRTDIKGGMYVDGWMRVEGNTVIHAFNAAIEGERKEFRFNGNWSSADVYNPDNWPEYLPEFLGGQD